MLQVLYALRATTANSWSNLYLTYRYAATHVHASNFKPPPLVVNPSRTSRILSPAVHQRFSLLAAKTAIDTTFPTGHARQGRRCGRDTASRKFLRPAISAPLCLPTLVDLDETVLKPLWHRQRTRKRVRVIDGKSSNTLVCNTTAE